MVKPLSLLIVDVSIGLEEDAKAYERGYRIMGGGSEMWQPAKGSLAGQKLNLYYPHGSLRAGLDAIVDTTRLAHQYGIPCYTVWYDENYADRCELPAHSLRPYLPEGNWYRKITFDAFQSPEFRDRLTRDNCEHLMVIGYDRDWCVTGTIEGAVSHGIQVVTSEYCMLTRDTGDRDASLEVFRSTTTFLPSLVGVWNYLRDYRYK